MNRIEEELCQLLDKAADFVKQFPYGGLSLFDSGSQMAAFLFQCKKAIEGGLMTSELRRRLWTVFAPTCDWDDIGGTPDLGNRIFGLLDSLYGDEIKNAPNRPKSSG